MVRDFSTGEDNTIMLSGDNDIISLRIKQIEKQVNYAMP